MEASGDYRWTNDRHLRFLKSIEATFVRTVLLEDSDRFLLRMDRYLPDRCESTLDSKKTTSCKKRRKRHFPSDNLDKKIARRLRIHSSFPPSLDDQIVPQMKRIKTGNNDKSWTDSSSSSS